MSEYVYEKDYSADDKVRAYVLAKYRADGQNLHLRQCPELAVARLLGSDGAYGCDTGCEYLRFEADLTCPHDEMERDYEWGTFGGMADLIEAIHTGEPAWMLE